MPGLKSSETIWRKCPAYMSKWSHILKFSMHIKSKGTFTYARSGCGADTGRFFYIPAALPWACSGIGRWMVERLVCVFEADGENWVSDPFVAEQILPLSHLRSTAAFVWTHVMTFVEANFSPTSLHVCSTHVWMYLESLAVKSLAPGRFWK